MLHTRPVTDAEIDTLHAEDTSARREIIKATRPQRLMIKDRVIGIVTTEIFSPMVISSNGNARSATPTQSIRLAKDFNGSLAHTKWWKHHRQAIKKAAKTRKGEQVIQFDVRYVDAAALDKAS